MAGFAARLVKLLRPQDYVWLLLMAALGFASPFRSGAEFEILTLLAVFQVAEPRLGFFQSSRGMALAIFVKLLLCYLLIGVTGGISSTYYLILMIPVVTAATRLGARGTLLVSLIACASYLSFLGFLDWNVDVIGPDEARQLCLRVVLFSVLALLTYQLASATREQSRQYVHAAEQLVEANRNLQEAEAAVRRSERLAALGQLTAGLAHELRNPLGTMRASADVLLQNIGAEQTVARELAGYISVEVDRTNSLITRFLDFARPLELRRSPTDLIDLLDRAVSTLQRDHPELKVEIYRNYSPDVAPLEIDGELMERVFYNLLLNAAQASPEGAPVILKTRPVPGGVEIAVIDRGSGIDPAQVENIFNPFFTTKPNGVGLGLAIVSKIVDRHGGKMAVESEPGQGSVFRVLLPSGNPA